MNKLIKQWFETSGKRAFSFILALSIIFSTISVIGLVAGAESATEKMLYIDATGGSRISAEYQLEKNAEYAVYFKYYVESGNFGISDSRSMVFSERWKDQYRHHSTHVSSGDDTFEKLNGENGWNDIELRFINNRETTDEHNHNLGFEFWGNSKIYIAEYSLYRISNGEKDLLDSGFNNWNIKSGNLTVKKMSYDESLFKDKMLNVSATNRIQYGLKMGLTAGTQYKIYYKYKVDKGVFGASDKRTIVFGDRCSDGTNRLLHSTHLQSLGNAAYPELQVPFEKGTGEDGWSDIELGFTASNTYSDPYQNHFLEFQFWGGENSIYIADFRVYRIENGEEKLIEIGLDGFVSFSGIPEIKKEEYNPELFKDEMVNISATGAMKYGLKMGLTAGTQYKIYYKYKVDKGVFGASDKRTIVFGDRCSDGTNRLLHSTHLQSLGNAAYPELQVPFEKGTGEDGWSDIELGFTASNTYSDPYQNHFLEFQFWGGENSIYIADFRVYRIENGEEKLIEFGLNGFMNFDGTPIAKTEHYNSEIFKEEMLNISATNRIQFGVKMGLTTGTQYKIYYKYKVEKGLFGASDSRTIVFSDRCSDGTNRLLHSTHLRTLGSAAYPELQVPFDKEAGEDGWSDIELGFTASNTYSDPYQNHFLEFQFWGGDNSIYIADFRMYRVENGEEKLIEFGLSGFMTFEGTPEIKKEEYDSEIFNGSDGYALRMTNEGYYGEESKFFGRNIALSGGKEYKISLKAFFGIGSLQHDSINLIVSDVPSGGKISKVYFSTDEKDSTGNFVKSSSETEALDEFTFKAPKDGTYYLAFEMKDKSSFNIANIAVSESNLNYVLNEDFSKGMDGWYSLNKTATPNSVFFNDNYWAEILPLSGEDKQALFSRKPYQKKMLYFNLGPGMRRWLTHSLWGKPGEKFKAQVTVGGVVDTLISVVSVGSNFNIAYSDMPVTSYQTFPGGYTAEYEFTVPKHVQHNNYTVQDIDGVNFGVVVPANSNGYILDMKVWRADDTTETNLLRNSDFKYGLSNWGMYWESELIGFRQDMLAKTEVSNENGSELKVIAFDKSTYMLHSDDTYYSDGEWWNPDDIVEKAPCTVNGTYVSKSGRGIKGVQLSLLGANEYKTKSGNGGSFKFTDVPEGDYELYVVSLDGTENNTGYSVTLSAGDTATVKIVAEEIKIKRDNTDFVKTDEMIGGIISGTVYTPQKKTISGMTVYLRGSEGETTVVTDKNGKFTFDSVKTGNYELYTLDENGNKYKFRDLTVKEAVALDMKLKYDNSEKSDEAENGFNLLWIIIPVAVIVVIAGAIVFVVIHKKRKKV